MGPKPSHFLFTVCQVGAEPALKAEVARAHPELRFSYSRPGFVTFKAPEHLEPSFELKSVLARAYGISRGKMKPDKVDAARDLAKAAGAKRLHVWERDRHAPQEAPKGFERGDWERAARSALAGIALQGEAKVGERVLDVVCVEEGEWWIGDHIHSGSHSPFPGGRPELKMPADSPSRAYLKLRDALLWSGAPLREGDVAVEVGSSPGGAAYALLEDGLSVVGIDPAAMDPRVARLAGDRFWHIARNVKEVPREELPERVQWLLLDVHLEPVQALSLVTRLALRMQDSLLGVIFTLKLGRWELIEELPEWLEAVREMGMARVRATQLSTNHQEICVYGLTRKGIARHG